MAGTGPFPTEDAELGNGLSDFILAFCTHNEYFEDIDKGHAEADFRTRDLGLRSRRGNFASWQVGQAKLQMTEFVDHVKAGKIDATSQASQEGFLAIMRRLDKALTFASRCLDEDSSAAKAPIAEQHFMDEHARHWVNLDGKGPRGPSGELRSVYGRRGESISPNWAALRSTGDDHFFGRMIVNHFMDLFFNAIYNPLRAVWYACMPGRSEAPSSPPDLEGRTLELLVTGFECLVAVLFVVISVVICSNVAFEAYRLVALSFLSLFFSFTIVFLSPLAMQIFMLTAGYWAVTIVFVSSTGSRSI